MTDRYTMCFKFHFLRIANDTSFLHAKNDSKTWPAFLGQLEFSGDSKSFFVHSNELPSKVFAFDRQRVLFYKNNDKLIASNARPLDLVKTHNSEFVSECVNEVANFAGFIQTQNHTTKSPQERFKKEQNFHDSWAANTEIDKIDIIQMNQSPTAPEMRFIVKTLGNLCGKKILDVGCGLGEASTLFALMGGDVTATDISPEMLKAAEGLAERYNVTITTHLSTAESLEFEETACFDIIYAGNLFHHVDIDSTLQRLTPYLSKDGMLVSWDPLHYNPAINIYRKLATEVRTDDEHPLKWSDLKKFNKYFKNVNRHYFWFTTLIVFILMFAVQRRNPNKERFWKVVVEEGNKWKWIYNPLELLDRAILFCLPFLNLLCWNVVVIAKNKKDSNT